VAAHHVPQGLEEGPKQKPRDPPVELVAKTGVVGLGKVKGQERVQHRGHQVCQQRTGVVQHIRVVEGHRSRPALGDEVAQGHPYRATFTPGG
jgi:hypothetical protein